MRHLTPLIALALWLVPVLSSSARAEPLTVFAAASLKNAFDAIADVFEAETGSEVVISYAGTSILARQIEQGAPADIFASAHPDWLTYLVERNFVISGSKQDFATNRLVLIAPLDTEFDASPALLDVDTILNALGEDGRMAVALTSAVPAGLYAREAMERLGVWEVLRTRIAETDNVRSALLLVARGEAPLGIVYQSDATAEPRVQTVELINAQHHARIAYSASQVTESTHRQAQAFLDFLTSPAARAALITHGFFPFDGPS
ncbi:MAG: molybdate ABC transporter substrate-binding protein [Pseudomonadota bacterium]